VFRWDALAQTVVQRTPLSQQEWTRSRACIVDGQGRVLADSAGRILQEVTDFPGRDELLRQPLAARAVEFQGRPHCGAHAASPGYQTYRSGWHSLLLQALQAAAARAPGRGVPGPPPPRPARGLGGLRALPQRPAPGGPAGALGRRRPRKKPAPAGPGLVLCSACGAAYLPATTRAISRHLLE